MQKLGIFTVAVTGLLGACVTVDAPIDDGGGQGTRAASEYEAAANSVAPSKPVKPIIASLPGDDEFTAPPILSSIMDGDTISLNLTMGAGAFPNVELENGEMQIIDGNCQFGPVEGVTQLFVPTGDNHLLMEITLGGVSFPANTVSCNYAPGAGGLPDPSGVPSRPTIVSVAGCYFVRMSSVPTANLLTLAPLPGAACGLHP